jgi:hypothetical protein
VRLESLAIDHPEESRAELGVLADELRDAGWEVQVAGEDEGTWARLEKSLGGEFVDVLNVVLSEAEHLTISAVLITIFNWARKRRFFIGTMPKPQSYFGSTGSPSARSLFRSRMMTTTRHRAHRNVLPVVAWPATLRTTRATIGETFAFFGPLLPRRCKHVGKRH